MNLDKAISLEMTLGHLLGVWHILSEKLSSIPMNDSFTETEKNAIWALEDICEQTLIDNGVNDLPEKEWNLLVQQAMEHIKTLPVEFVNNDKAP